MKTTEYFRGQVIRKRPYIKMEWVERAVNNPLKQEVQGDGPYPLLDLFGGNGKIPKSCLSGR
jgi:hypothetical protein